MYTQIKLPIEVHTTVSSDLSTAISTSGLFCSHALDVCGAIILSSQVACSTSNGPATSNGKLPACMSHVHPTLPNAQSVSCMQPALVPVDFDMYDACSEFGLQ